MGRSVYTSSQSYRTKRYVQPNSKTIFQLTNSMKNKIYGPQERLSPQHVRF